MNNIGCWNIRGLNDPLKQVEVSNLIRNNNIKICGLVETLVQESNKDIIRNNILPSWMYSDNYSYHALGRIWLLWDPVSVKINFLFSSAQYIFVRASICSYFCLWVQF